MNTISPQPVRKIAAVAHDRSDARLSTIRRLYFYLVALISSTAMLVALDRLLDALASSWLGGRAIVTVSGTDFVRSMVAGSAGVLVVAAPIFLLHWAVIQGRLDHPGERGAALRKFFLYVASAIAVGFVIAYSQQLMGGAARLAFGDAFENSTLFPSRWANLLATGVAAALLLWYWQSVLRQDGDLGQEAGAGAVWRRLWQAGVILTGLIMAATGFASVLSGFILWLLDLGSPTIGWSWLPAQAGSGVGRMIVGLLVSHLVWTAWQALTERHPEEDGSSVKRLFLYVAVVGGAVATLVPVALVIRTVLLILFGETGAGVAIMLRGLAWPLGLVPAGVFVWQRYWKIIERLQAGQSETPEAATIRRIYFYAVAATGLVLVWLGSVFLVQSLLDVLLTTDQLKAVAIWRRPLANGLSLLAVGAPVWALHWRSVQSSARLLSPDGAEERASMPRRIYLYAISFAGAILILYYVAQVIYRILLYALGDTTVALLSPELAENIARSLIAALLWLVHLLALRGDGQLGTAALEDRAEDEATRTRRRTRLAERAAALEEELAAVRAQLAALDGDGTA